MAVKKFEKDPHLVAEDFSELYQDIDYELDERLMEMELEYLFPEKNWDLLSPEDQLILLSQFPYLSEYYGCSVNDKPPAKPPHCISTIHPFKESL